MAEIMGNDMYNHVNQLDNMLSNIPAYSQEYGLNQGNLIDMLNENSKIKKENLKFGIGDKGQILVYKIDKIKGKEKETLIFENEKEKEQDKLKGQIKGELKEVLVKGNKPQNKEKIASKVINKISDAFVKLFAKINNFLSVSEAEGADLQEYLKKMKEKNKQKEQTIEADKQTIEADKQTIEADKQTIEASKRRQKELDKAIDQNHKAIDQMKIHIKQMQFLEKNIDNGNMKNELLEAIRIARETNYGEEGNKKSMNNYREAKNLLDRYERIVNNY